MKRWFWLMLLVTVSLAAQQSVPTTPNLKLNLPPHNTPNWDIYLNQNFLALDSYLSGVTPIPSLAITGPLVFRSLINAPCLGTDNNGVVIVGTCGSGFQPVLSSLTLSPTSVLGGASSTGTATITGSAPSGGAVVALTSSNTAAAQVPANVTIPASNTTSTFTVTTTSVSSNTSLTISGTYGATQVTNFTVTAPPPPPEPIYGGVGQPGATSTATLSGTQVTLSTGDILHQLQTTPEQPGESWSFSPVDQVIYLLLVSASHSFVDANTGQILPFNPPITVNLSGRTLYLYQTVNQLSVPFSPKIVN